MILEYNAHDFSGAKSVASRLVRGRDATSLMPPIEALDPICSAELLASHCPIVDHKGLITALDAIEKLEKTASLYLLPGGRTASKLLPVAVEKLKRPSVKRSAHSSRQCRGNRSRYANKHRIINLLRKGKHRDKIALGE